MSLDRLPDIGKCALACGFAFVLLAQAINARASEFKVLYSFQGGNDGISPNGGLIRDKAGNLYGTTMSGGGTGCTGYGCGTVFKIAADGSEAVLYAFIGGNDGVQPYAGLIADKAGNLYGTTYAGGAGGVGTVFKVAADGTESVLHSFSGSDGATPEGNLIADKGGNLYGTTSYGGTYGGGCGDFGCGTLFKLAPDGTETVLHAFTRGNDGAGPDAGLIVDKKGNFYSTTYFGGAYDEGTIFALAPDGTQTILYAFDDSRRGELGSPVFGVLADAGGDLYTTLWQGGTKFAGAVFELAANGSPSTLYSFSGGSDGDTPLCNLISDRSENLYGDTELGGVDGEGTVFKVTTGGKETVLHSFAGSDGRYPYGGLIADTKGNLYGTTYSGGTAGNGVAFSVKE